MDYRFFKAKIGQPIPAWDMAHQLPIYGWVGPVCRDDSTIFRLNSTCMDVSEQSHLTRHEYSFGLFLLVLATGILAWFLIFLLLDLSGKERPIDFYISVSILMAGFLGFLIVIIKLGRHEFFGRKYYPVRFHRIDKKIYALVRNKRGRNSGPDADCIEEFEWGGSSIFCIHREDDDIYHYWVRCYRLDLNGNVEIAMDIGRDWITQNGLESLLAQWNYWCWYMNRGPENLPKPRLFLPEVESIYESFLCCSVGQSFRESPIFWIISFPYIFLMASLRIVSLSTCSSPRWPSWIAKRSMSFQSDKFDEPRSPTPIGWRATDAEIAKKIYPEMQSMKIDDWKGDPVETRNAYVWAEDSLDKRSATEAMRKWKAVVMSGRVERVEEVNRRGEGIIRIGDRTNHGGEVVSVSSNHEVQGFLMAMEGDLVNCPICKGIFAITSQPYGRYLTHDGKLIAYAGDRTSCGAKLISSILRWEA